MWQEFALTKELWIGGTLERRGDFLKSELVDIEYYENTKTIVFIGKDFRVAANENNIEIRGTGTGWIEIKLLGDNTRWRLMRPNSARPAASPTSAVTPDKSAHTPTL